MSSMFVVNVVFRLNAGGVFIIIIIINNIMFGLVFPEWTQ